jgi:hypothetical protein
MEPIPSPRIILQFPKLFGRLTEYRLGVEFSASSHSLGRDDLPVVLKLLCNIKILHFRCVDQYGETGSIELKLPALRDLGLWRMPLTFANADVYLNVVNMVLGCDRHSTPSNPQSIIFPSLEKLTIYGSWVDLHLVQAPKLRELRLQASGVDRSLTFEKLQGIKLHPPVLRVEKEGLDSQDLTTLLKCLWDSIEELHLITRLTSLERSIPSMLEAALHNITHERLGQPLYPHLWCLTVSCSSVNDGVKDIFMKGIPHAWQKLVGYAQGLKVGGLKRVRCDWATHDHGFKLRDTQSYVVFPVT